MTLDTFIAKYDDKEVDWDAQYGNQCKDLFSAYNTEVVENPNYVWGNANELWDNAPSEYYSKEQDPQKGDVVIWSTSPYGHVAIFIEKKEGGFTSFDQNYPIGSPCHYQGHTFTNILGYLRPKGDNVCQECDKIRKEYDAKIYHGCRNFVYECRNPALFRAGHATEAEVEADAQWMLRVNGNAYNLPGFAQRFLTYWNSDETKAYLKKIATDATKVAQAKCDATIASLEAEQIKEMKEHQAFAKTAEAEMKKRDDIITKMQIDYGKEMTRMQGVVDGKEKSIIEIEELYKAELLKSEKKVADLQIKLNGLTERVVVESLIINWIKKLFKRGV